MFKNAILYRAAQLAPVFDALDPDAESLLAMSAFQPCAPSQPLSSGWVPPRGPAGGPLIENIGGAVIVKLMTEAKVLPGDAVKRKVEEKCKAIEQTTGRKPGKKQTKEIKEEVLLALLPTALTRRSSMLIWIDRTNGRIVLDTASSTKADDAVTMLVKSLQLVMAAAGTQVAPAAAMSDWLVSGEPPDAFSVDRECELQSCDEMRSVVRYGRHALDIEEVRAHIQNGKIPTRLALTWNGRVSFVLSDGMAMRKLAFLEGVFANKPDDADAFDADVTISTGELGKLIDDLTDALGGWTPMPTIAPNSEASDPRAGVDNAMREDGATATLSTGGVVVATFGEGPDPLLEQARALVVKHQRPSISLIQRHLRIGYNRAARLLEALESAGVVGAMNTDGQRQLLATT